uniref:hypothetical protein n=1 Tax=Litoreibacter halocynthiae TaxID=1242689 RepID=UPI00249156FE
RERVPLSWARTQHSLGITLRTLGERESGTTRLEESVMAFRSVLEEYTQDNAPWDWALAQYNLGKTLSLLGERENGTVRLEEAILAYRAALEETSRDKYPLRWAAAIEFLGLTEMLIFQKNGETTYLTRAKSNVALALEVYKAANATSDIEKSARISAYLATLAAEPEELTEEEKAFLDRWSARTSDIAEAVAELKIKLHEETDPAERADIQRHIEIGEKLLGKLEKPIAD